MPRPATTIVSLSVAVAVLIAAWFLFATRVTETRPALPAATSNPPQQGAESIDGWKVYTNEEYGFAFAYPANWEFREFAQFGGYTVSFGPYLCDDCPDTLSISIRSGSLEDVRTELNATSTHTVNVDGHVFTMFRYTHPMWGDEFEKAAIARDGTIYVVSYGYGGRELRQILSGFRFLESSTRL